MKKDLAIFGTAFVILLCLFAVFRHNYKPLPTPTPSTAILTVTETETEPETETETTTTFELFSVPLDVNVQWYISAQCEVKQIPPALVVALIWQETRYRNDVVGSQGELGLMQVHPVNAAEVAKVLNVTDLTDPFQNCKAGLYILDSSLEAADGEYGRALMVYNLGLSGAKAEWVKGNYSTDFTRSVLTKMAELEAQR